MHFSYKHSSQIELLLEEANIVLDLLSWKRNMHIILTSTSDVYVGSFSRSAVNFMAGCHTAVSNIVMSVVVLLTLEFITPLFKYTPNAVLASIIIAAVLGLVDVEAAVLLWKIDKFDFVACMGAFFGVIFKSVEIGLLIAVK